MNNMDYYHFGIGGIVGTGFDLISDCSATAEITVLGDDGACAGVIAGCIVEDVTINVSSTTDSVGGLIGAGKEMMEGSDVMSSFKVNDCTVSGSITGGRNSVGTIVGDPQLVQICDKMGYIKLSDRF